MKFKLRIWRQNSSKDSGQLVDYDLDGVTADMSFLEMLDVLNVKLIHEGKEPVQFDHDCREGICGSCSLVINGDPHGKDKGTSTCQLHMRRFQDGETIVIEPWRAKSFPVLRDLCVDRRGLDRIMAAGGFVSINTGNATEANNHLIHRDTVETAMDAAQCIGCGACVAACKNASAMLFVAAKVSHLALLPQGQVERKDRVAAMLKTHDEEGFGACSNTGACEAACPKEISLENIARMNREYARALLCRG